jgi:hypothetical protein
MKPILLLFALLSGVAAWAADAVPIQFKAVLVMGTEKRFSLTTEGAARSDWVAAGQEFEGYKVVRYIDTESSLLVSKDGQEFRLRLATAKIGDGDVATATKATLQDAEALLQKMNFESLIGKLLAQQKQAGASMAKQMVAQMGGPGAKSEEVAAFQQKVMDMLFEALDPKALKDDVAKIYSEVFTKEEMNGLSEFYGTPAGRAMIDKQPEISQKMNAVIMPRMMAVMPKIQGMAKEMKAQAAKPGTGAPVAPPPPKN